MGMWMRMDHDCVDVIYGRRYGRCRAMGIYIMRWDKGGGVGFECGLIDADDRCIYIVYLVTYFFLSNDIHCSKGSVSQSIRFGSSQLYVFDI